MLDHADALRLIKAYSPADAEQQELRADYLTHLTANPNGTRRECLPDHLTASGIIFDPEEGNVLLGLHARAGIWLQLGGHIEDRDASIPDAALRETTEESGIEGLRLASPLPIRLDRHTAPCAPGARHHLDVQFLVIAPPGSETIISPEQLDLRWCPYDSLPEPLGSGVRGLIDAALLALRQS